MLYEEINHYYLCLSFYILILYVISFNFRDFMLESSFWCDASFAYCWNNNWERRFQTRTTEAAVRTQLVGDLCGDVFLYDFAIFLDSFMMTLSINPSYLKYWSFIMSYIYKKLWRTILILILMQLVNLWFKLIRKYLYKV